jgi:hypothetical protein
VNLNAANAWSTLGEQFSRGLFLFEDVLGSLNGAWGKLQLWILVISLLIGTAFGPEGTAAGWEVFEAQGIAALILVVVEHVVKFVHSFFKL